MQVLTAGRLGLKLAGRWLEPWGNPGPRGMAAGSTGFARPEPQNPAYRLAPRFLHCSEKRGRLCPERVGGCSLAPLGGRGNNRPLGEMPPVVGSRWRRKFDAAPP